MNQKAMLVVGAVVLVLACSGIAYWLGRSSNPSVIETPPAPQATKPATIPATTPDAIPDTLPTTIIADEIDVEPSLAVGSRVEALSAEGWQLATIREISTDQALIAYEHSSLGEERVDVRLLRKPESELVPETVPAPPRDPMPDIVTNPTTTTPPAQPLGPRPTALEIPEGDYTCHFDPNSIVTIDAPTDEDGAPIEITLTIEIVSDRVYRAFNGEDDNYSYDPASGRITWEDGMLGAEEPGQYQADSQSIVTSVGGHALTCRLGS